MRLLMLDQDALLLTAVTRTLGYESIDVTGVADLRDARTLALTGQFCAALLDGEQVIESSDLNAFSIPRLVLCTLSPGVRADHPWFDGVRVLRKPFTSGELLASLREGCCRPLACVFPERLMDALLKGHRYRLSMCLRAEAAEIAIERGEIVHAHHDGLRGELALASLLALPPGPFVQGPLTLEQRTIERPFQSLMFDVLHELDERDREPSVPRAHQPGTMLSDGGEIGRAVTDDLLPYADPRFARARRGGL